MKTTTDDTISGASIPRKAIPDYCETPTAKGVRDLCAVCQALGELAIVTGEPGVGKTTAVKRYAATKEAAYLMTASPAASAVVPCLERVGAVLGTYPSGSGGSAWTEAIRLRLAQEQDPPLLLIDEAQHLADPAVEELRAIFDATPALGLVFIGSRELRERWSGRRWAQLTSRMFQRMDIDGPLSEDVEAICSAHGVDGKQPRALMRRAAARPGGLRVVRKLIANAAALAGPGQPMTAAHIEAAFRDRVEMAS